MQQRLRAGTERRRAPGSKARGAEPGGRLAKKRRTTTPPGHSFARKVTESLDMLTRHLLRSHPSGEGGTPRRARKKRAKSAPLREAAQPAGAGAPASAPGPEAAVEPPRRRKKLTKRRTASAPLPPTANAPEERTPATPAGAPPLPPPPSPRLDSARSVASAVTEVHWPEYADLTQPARGGPFPFQRTPSSPRETRNRTLAHMTRADASSSETLLGENLGLQAT